MRARYARGRRFGPLESWKAPRDNERGETPARTAARTAASQPNAALAAAIIARPDKYYVNVHTTDFPGGAIRGQLG